MIAAQEQAEEAPGLRARKKLQVRDALAQAALELFVARGFEAVTVDEIAVAAEVSRRTFFRYFATKEDVVFARRQDQLARFREALAVQAARARTPYDGARAVFVAMAEEYERERARILVERRLVRGASSLVARDLELDREYEDALARTLAPRGAGASSKHRARLCAAAMMAVVRVCIDAWAERGGRGDLALLGAEALSSVAALAP